MHININKTKIILALSFLLIFFSAANIADAAVFGLSSRGIPNAGLNNGLVGWWTFDGKDIVNGVLKDMSGNSKDGNFSGISSSTFFSVGKLGQAGNFDGGNDRVSSALNVCGSTIATFSFWIKHTEKGNDRILYQSGVDGWSLDTDLNNNILFTDSVYEAITNYSAEHSLNVWEHWVFVYNGNMVGNSARLVAYKDGVQVPLTYGGTVGPNLGTCSNSLIIGEGIRGAIDDVRIFNRELSAMDVSNLYNRDKVNTSSGSKGLPYSGLNSGLVGNWSFDGKDIIDGVMRDASGYNNNGNFFNISTSTFFVPGKIGQAGNFDGVNDYLTVSNHSSIQFDQTIPFSLSFWYKSTSKLTENGMIAFKTNGFEGWRVYISSSDSKVYFRIHTFDFSYTITSTGTVVDGDWHYITVTYSGNSNRTGMSVYVDALSPVVGTASNIGQTFLNSSTLYIGRTSGATERVKGYLDNVRLYNRALSESEIRQLYRLGAGAKIASTVMGIPSTGLNSGLTGWWTFDGKDVLNGVVKDRSGNGYNGNPISIASSTFYAMGKMGQGVKFDQVTNSYINLGANTTLTSGQPFSISWWEKITDNSRITGASADYPSRFNFDIGGSSVNFLVLRIRSNATYAPVAFGISPSGAVSVLGSVSTPSIASSINIWRHFVITGSDPTATSPASYSFYSDGVSLAVTQPGGIFSSLVGNNRIGYDGGDNPAGATLDDVRVYNRRLSAQEVVQLYRQGR